MHSLSGILLPVDFSERAVGAARCAVSLARHFHSRLTLLHVIPPLQYGVTALEAGGPMMGEIYGGLTSQCERALADFLAPEFAGLAVNRVVLEGDPATCVVEFAHSRATDLIVMPTHGYGPFRRFILGSNTAKVLHDADCPIWTGVHMRETPASGGRIAKILCAVDLGPQSAKTVSWAGWLAQGLGASLTLLHATASAPHSSPELLDHARRIRECVADELDLLKQNCGVPAEVLIESGDPAAVICAAAERQQADLLVIGRGSAAGAMGRLRTNAYAIIRQSPCPVVSV